MRIRINLLALLRSLVKIAGTVVTVGELVLATQGQRATDGGEPLDLDAVRAGGPASSGSSSAPANTNDPSAAH